MRFKDSFHYVLMFFMHRGAPLSPHFIINASTPYFKMIQNVTGIGPRLALNVLSGMDVASFKLALGTGDVKRLSSINGIGKKTAERMVLELKDKVGSVDSDLPTALGQAPAGSDRNITDTVAALEALGSKPAEAQKAAKAALAMLGPEAAVEELVRAALKGGK